MLGEPEQNDTEPGSHPRFLSPPDRVGREGKRFLVVAPDQTAADRLAAHLITAGHGHVDAATFRDLARRLVQLAPDLVVTDVASEPSLALDALHCIRDHRPDLSPSVIVCGMTTSASNRAAVLNAGAADYLIHPVEGPELLARVQLTLRNQDLIACLEARAHRDALTGLANRHALISRLEAEWSRALRARQPLAVLMVDLDHFKAINDQFGHINGDRILRHVARILQLAIRSHDLAVRFGGEEFAILAANCTILTAARIAERCRRHLARHPIVIHNQPRHITVSIGAAAAVPADLPFPLDTSPLLTMRESLAPGSRPLVSLLPTDHLAGSPSPCTPLFDPHLDPSTLLSPDMLFAQADHALYQAKAHGRDTAWFWYTERRVALPTSRITHPYATLRIPRAPRNGRADQAPTTNPARPRPAAPPLGQFNTDA